MPALKAALIPIALRTPLILLEKESLNFGSRNSPTSTRLLGMWSHRKLGQEAIFSARLGRPSWASGRKTHIENGVILTAAHERRVHVAAVEPLEAPGLSVLLGEGHGPPALEVDGVGEH